MAPPHPLSLSEISYLRTSLLLTPPIRPDGRSATTFRPLTAELDILPSTHGSSRVVWPDGGECIVGIKLEVEPTLPAGGAGAKNWVNVSVDVAGAARDDDPLAVFLAASVSDTLAGKLSGRLAIGERWHWRLFIDILLLTPPVSHPATLLSLATNLALRSTHLPRLVSAAEEDPHFDDDWAAATPLYPFDAAAAGDVPAVTLLVAAVGPNLLFDPTREEMAVSDCCLAISVDWDGKVTGVRILETGSGGMGNGGEVGGGLKVEVLKKIVDEGRVVAKGVYTALEGIVKASEEC